MKANIFSSFLLVALSLPTGTYAYAQANEKITVSAGTKFKARLETPLSTKISEPGDNVIITLNEPVIIDSQHTLPRGLEMTGKVTSGKRAGRVKGRAQLFVLINELRTQYGTEPIFVSVDAADDMTNDEKYRTDPEGKLESPQDLGDDFNKVARGASFGALVTMPVSIAGHHTAAAIAGPSIGGAAGLLFSRGKEIRLPAGSILRMKFDKDLILPPSTIQVRPTENGQMGNPARAEELRRREQERGRAYPIKNSPY